MQPHARWAFTHTATRAPRACPARGHSPPLMRAQPASGSAVSGGWGNVIIGVVSLLLLNHSCCLLDQRIRSCLIKPGASPLLVLTLPPPPPPLPPNPPLQPAPLATGIATNPPAPVATATGRPASTFQSPAPPAAPG